MSLLGLLRGEKESTLDIEIDEALDLLGNERRRLMIDVLAEKRDVTLRQLAKRVAAIEYDTTPERLNSDQYKRVYISIYQHHLLLLENSGVIEQDRNRVTATDEVEGLARVLEAVREEVSA